MKKLTLSDFIKGSMKIAQSSLGIHACSEECTKERLTICYNCEHLELKETGLDNFKARCKICGCFIKFKTKIKNAHCDLGKW